MSRCRFIIAPRPFLGNTHQLVILRALPNYELWSIFGEVINPASVPIEVDGIEAKTYDAQGHLLEAATVNNTKLERVEQDHPWSMTTIGPKPTDASV